MEIIIGITLIFITTFAIFGIINVFKQINHIPNLNTTKPILTYKEWHRNRDKMAEQYAKDNPEETSTAVLESEIPIKRIPKKRKPKTVAEWEDIYDLGGRE